MPFPRPDKGRPANNLPSDRGKRCRLIAGIRDESAKLRPAAPRLHIHGGAPKNHALRPMRMPRREVNDDLATKGIAYPVGGLETTRIKKLREHVGEFRNAKQVARLCALAVAWEVGHEHRRQRRQEPCCWEHVTASDHEAVHEDDGYSLLKDLRVGHHPKRAPTCTNPTPSERHVCAIRAKSPLWESSETTTPGVHGRLISGRAQVTPPPPHCADTGHGRPSGQCLPGTRRQPSVQAAHARGPEWWRAVGQADDAPLISPQRLFHAGLRNHCAIRPMLTRNTAFTDGGMRVTRARKCAKKTMMSAGTENTEIIANSHFMGIG